MHQAEERIWRENKICMGSDHEIKAAFQIRAGKHGLLNKYIGKITIWGENEIRSLGHTSYQNMFQMDRRFGFLKSKTISIPEYNQNAPITLK